MSLPCCIPIRWTFGPACFSFIRRAARWLVREFQSSAALVLAALIGAGAYADNGPRANWSITDLGTLGGNFSSAWSINDNGQIVGYSIASDGSSRAFLYKDGTMTDVGPSMSYASGALDINNAGKVVGYAAATMGEDRAYLYNRGAVKTLVDKIGLAWAINDSGAIVGDARIGPNQEFRAFLYRRGEVKELGTLGGAGSAALDINNKGQVVGYADVSSENSFNHAYVYDQRGMTDLGTLGGWWSAATGINEKGEVVGDSTMTRDGVASHAFLFSKNKMHDLGTLGGSDSSATDINNRGQVVGWSSTGYGLGHAFLYSEGEMLDLNSFPEVQQAGWTLLFAQAINNAGQIVGTGDINGERHAYLLTPGKNKAREYATLIPD